MDGVGDVMERDPLKQILNRVMGSTFTQHPDGFFPLSLEIFTWKQGKQDSLSLGVFFALYKELHGEIPGLLQLGLASLNSSCDLNFIYFW